MGPTERRDYVMKAVIIDGKVEIEKLSEELEVSPMTIRRDLDQLEEEGRVIRIHGGAVLPQPIIAETPFSTKESRRNVEKKQIAKKAISLVKEGQTIILDSGTTTLEIARLLVTFNQLTVITNDIKIAAELMESSLKVIVTGGEIQNGVGALYGPLTHRVLKDIHVDLFFLGAHAIDVESGITAPTFEKAYIKQLMIQAAETTWLVSDISKVKQKSFSKVCGLNELSGYIADDGITPEMKEELSEYIKVL